MPEVEVIRKDIPNRMNREKFLGMKNIFRWSFNSKSGDAYSSFMKEMIAEYDKEVSSPDFSSAYSKE